MAERRYEKWAGNERGTAEDPARCIAQVYGQSQFIASQCGRKRGKGPDDLYCGQHAKMLAERRYVWAPTPEPPEAP